MVLFGLVEVPDFSLLLASQRRRRWESFWSCLRSRISVLSPQALVGLVGLVRGDVPAARVVMLRIVPGKVALEISNGLYVIQKEGSNSGNPPHVPKPEKQSFL